MIKQWSPSRIFKYEQCPRRAKYEFVDKRPEAKFEKTPALVRGEEHHAHLENYISGRVPDLDPELPKMAAVADLLREEYKQGKVRVEVDLAITRKWTPTKWLAPDVWGRFKIDVLKVVDRIGRVIDWKTGKYKPDGEHSDQLHAYSTAALSVVQDVDVMTSCLIFTDHTDVPVERPEGTVTKEKLGWSQEYWNDRVAVMERDTIFAPRPSYECKWCPFTRNKGGPCEF